MRFFFADFCFAAFCLSAGFLVGVVRNGNRSHIRTDAFCLRIDQLVVDGARIRGAHDAGGRIDGHVSASGKLKTERWNRALGRLLHGYANRQKSLDGMQAEARLIAMMAQAPRKNAHLVEIKRHARFVRRHHGEVHRHLVIGRGGIGIVDLGEHPAADESLVLAVLRHFVGNIHVEPA